MNPEEIQRAIAKFKARKAKACLAYYSLLISLFLAVSSFGNGLTLTSLITFLLILPLPLYFGLQCLKLSHKLRALKSRTVVVQPTVSSAFSLGQFLTQPNLAFRLSLVLLLLICATTLARLRTPEPTLTMNPHPLVNNQ